MMRKLTNHRSSQVKDIPISCNNANVGIDFSHHKATPPPQGKKEISGIKKSKMELEYNRTGVMCTNCEVMHMPVLIWG